MEIYDLSNATNATNATNAKTSPTKFGKGRDRHMLASVFRRIAKPIRPKIYIRFYRNEQLKQSIAKINKRIERKVAEYKTHLSVEHAELSINHFKRNHPYYFKFEETKFIPGDCSNNSVKSLVIRIDNAETGERFMTYITAEQLPAECIKRNITLTTYAQQLRCAEFKKQLTVYTSKKTGGCCVWFEYDEDNIEIRDTVWEYPIDFQKVL